MKFYLCAIISIAFSLTNTFKYDVNSNLYIIESLYSNSNWEIIESTNDSIIVSNKKINESNINAIKVEKVVKINPENFKYILMNVNDYESFLSNSKSFKSKVIESNSSDLIGYQHIIVDIPFIQDREYYFHFWN